MSKNLLTFSKVFAEMEIDVIEAIYSLSPLQQGILFHAINSPASQAYLVQTAYELNGQLQVAYWQQAWQEVVERHPALRTAFVWEEVDHPVQVVCSEVQFGLVEVDWTAKSPAEQAASLPEFLQTDRAQGFDLAQAPLMRLHLFQLSAERYYFVWTMHHLILDGWSVSLVFNEVLDRYATLCQEYQSLWLPPAPVYRDYINWLSQQDLEEAQNFWQEKLAKIEAATPLGLDRPRAVQGSSETDYADAELFLSLETCHALRAFCRRHHLTLNTVMQGIWANLLHRYSGEQAVVFGSVVSGRPPELVGVEEMVGLFINTLPVVVKIEPEMSLVDWLKNLQAAQLELGQFEFSPLAAVQGWSNLPKGQSLFESLYIFENYLDKGYEAVNEVGLSVHDLASHERTNYPLTLDITPGEQLRIHIGYQTARFSSEAIAQILSHIESAVASLLAVPEQAVTKLEILSQAERAKLLTDFSAPLPPAQADSPATTIHALFEEQVARTPHAVALEFEAEQLSYAELNQQANRLARHLQSLGVDKDSLVGVCLDRNVQMVVALLAILKAGGCYVPLDPAYPQERLDFMLADCRAKLVISQSATLERIGLPTSDTSRQFLLLEGDWWLNLCADVATSEENPTSPADANSLAYMIYTSGSTGKPKGVLVEHRGMVNLLRANRQRFGFGQTATPETFPCLASFAFDIFGFELYNPLVNGGKALMISREHLLDMPRLLVSLQTVELLHTVPSLMRQLLTAWQSLPAHEQKLLAFDRLRHIFIGGDAVNTELLEEMRRVFPHARINVLYGPTETTIICTSYPVPNLAEQTELSPAKIIGSGLAGAKLLVLDKSQRLAPIGVNGELYIGGVAVSRGYHERAELTTEKFVELDGERFYRSGDAVRWLSSGELEFVGRVDNQVKIRGYRIEPGEIENVLNRQAGVRESLVIVREDQPGDKRLVAYVIAESGAELSRTELRKGLAAVLPDYMLPSSFVILASFPLNANGKVDRKTLPLPSYEQLEEARASYQAPRTPVEQTLVKIWSEVLNVPVVGIYDNFFELGGDSILTIQIVARASQAGLRFTPKQLFENPTIVQLGGLLVQNYIAGRVAAEAATNHEPLSGEVLLTPIQRWFFEQAWSQPQHFNMSMLLELNAPVAPERLEQAAAKLLQQHDALRLSFTQKTESGWQAAYLPFEPATLKKVVRYYDLSNFAGAAQTKQLQAAVREVQSSFQLSQDYLLRLAYFEVGAGSAPKLLVAVHHLAMDSVSWPTLLQDLTDFYCDESATGPAKTTSVQEWAYRLHEYAASPEVAAEISYWQNQLNPCNLGMLPTDLSSEVAANTLASSASRQIYLEKAATDALLHRVPANSQMRINEVLLTALGQTLCEWCGSSAVAVELEGHGRADLFEQVGVDLSRTVGWFTTVYPLRLECGQTAGEALRKVKEQVRQVPQQGIGYGLARYLQTAEADFAKVRPQVSFNYLGQRENGLLGDGRLFKGLVSDSENWLPTTEQGGDGPRSHLLTINALIVGNRLLIDFEYSRALYRAEVIAELSEKFKARVETLIDYCLQDQTPVYTPSDFPDVELSQSELDDLMNYLN